jgi:hypothetical protein
LIPGGKSSVGGHKNSAKWGADSLVKTGQLGQTWSNSMLLEQSSLVRNFSECFSLEAEISYAGAAGGLGGTFCRSFSSIKLVETSHSHFLFTIFAFTRRLLEAGASVVGTDFDASQLAKVCYCPFEWIISSKTKCHNAAPTESKLMKKD